MQEGAGSRQGAWLTLQLTRISSLYLFLENSIFFQTIFAIFFSVHPYALSVDANAILFVVVVPIVVSLALSISFLFYLRE